MGTWQSEDHWAEWHEDEDFRQTRERLAGLEAEPNVTAWFRVLSDIRPEAGGSRGKAAARTPEP